MATTLKPIYQAFLAKITADDWTANSDEYDVQQDWRKILDMAIFRFKYPRVNLTITEMPAELDTDPPFTRYGFSDTLAQDEIQLLALYMKHEWVKRCIASWENIKMLYVDSDFSNANHLDKLNKLQEAVAEEIMHAEGIYDRSRNKRPSSLFKKLAGKRHAE